MIAKQLVIALFFFCIVDRFFIVVIYRLGKTTTFMQVFSLKLQFSTPQNHFSKLSSIVVDRSVIVTFFRS